jgi:hypothetical protein
MRIRYLSSTLLRASLPVLGAALVCGMLLYHLPPAQPSRAGAARQPAALLAVQTTITPGLEIVLEQPVLTPPAVECKKDFWQPIPSGRDTTAYLTMNVNTPAASTNSGEWRPNLPARGYYLIEAYIPLHAPIDFCTDGIGVIASDTTQAHYTVRHSLGSSEVVRSQVLPITATRWVSLGEFLLPPGTEAFVRLTDLNSETSLSHTVSFSAMRFTYVRPAPQPVHFPLVANAYRNPLLPPAVVLAQGQGIDACGMPTLEYIYKLQTWWDESPYQALGLYMGGVHYPTSCTQIDPAWVSAVSAQGWQFMPLWVGPQAPCTTYKYRLSYDPAEAYLQGRSEAELASTAARSLGLANPDLGGTLVYYDMEAYGSTDTACITAVGSFINGWTQRLHELGNIAGVYSSACSPPPTYLAALPNVPDIFWGAYYSRSDYDPNISVFDMPCFSDSLWAYHQRIFQYAGSHKEIWGGIDLTIDSNVIDGAVLEPTLVSGTASVKAGAPEALPALLPTALIQDTGWLSAQEGWLVQAGRLYWSADGGQTWLERTPTGVAVLLAAFSSTDEGWALQALPGGGIMLNHTQDGGAHWDAAELPASEGAWQPIQLRMEAEGGWIVLRRATSAAFDVAVLLRSSDGGRTWQASDLPASGTISFAANGEGWLEARQTAGWYRTTDGGQTWQPTAAKAVPAAATGMRPPQAGSLPGNWVLAGTTEAQISWAVTRRSACSGEKGSPGFSCLQADALWLTRDGGETWQAAALP